jgi:hypothetical protein
MTVPCDVAGCPNPARWYYPKPTLFGWNLCDTCKDTDPRGVDCLPIEGKTMKTIYKYAAPIDDNLTITMPAGAEVLCVQMQGGGPQVWALVDPSAAKQARGFCWRGTGHPADNLGRYVGTVQMRDGALVFHLFEAPGL